MPCAIENDDGSSSESEAETPKYVRVVQGDSDFSESERGNASDGSQASDREKSYNFVEASYYGPRNAPSRFPQEIDMLYHSDIIPELRCGMCKDFLGTPVQVPVCGHKFCKDCISGVVSQPRVNGYCPTCNRKFDIRMIGPILGYASVIQLLRAQKWCMNALCYDQTTRSYRKDPEACTFFGREHELRKHAKTCGFKAAQCSLGCKSMLWKKDVAAHEDICKIKCPQQPCEMLVLAKHLEHHKKEECIATILNCPMVKAGCTQKAQRQSIQSHVDKCPYALKAEIDRLKREKEAESVEKEKWKQLAKTLTPVKKEVKEEVLEPACKRLRSRKEH